MDVAGFGWYFVCTRFLQVARTTFAEGISYALSNRDSPMKDSALAGRIQRAKVNLAENLIIFASLVLITKFANASSGLSSLGAQVFFGGRLVHAISYVSGVTVVRSLGYTIGLTGMVMVTIAILQR
ncbi:MAG: MAPEG family protein [Oscillatoriales cyanobacterium SM2_2_1]|nr:MAPEG family protein [Oscillatoriales cyanobacterium SM2_2_1]